jgi:hypothetical protein
MKALALMVALFAVPCFGRSDVSPRSIRTSLAIFGGGRDDGSGLVENK